MILAFVSFVSFVFFVFFVTPSAAQVVLIFRRGAGRSASLLNTEWKPDGPTSCRG